MLLDEAIKGGIFCAMFVALLFYVFKKNENREKRLEEQLSNSDNTNKSIIKTNEDLSKTNKELSETNRILVGELTNKIAVMDDKIDTNFKNINKKLGNLIKK